MRNRIFIIIICILVFTSAFTACDANKPIKIGFIGTLSGLTSDAAAAGKRGVQIAVDMINSSGGVNGRNIELVVKDSLNDSEIAKRMAAEFLEEDIQLVIGDFTSGLTESALKYIEGKNILYLSPTASSAFFTAKDDNLIRFTGTTKTMVKALVQQAEINDDKNFVIIKDENNKAYVDPFSDELEIRIEDYGGSIVEQIYFNSTTAIDSSFIINKLQESDGELDGIFILANASSTIIIVQALKENNIDLGIYTSGWSNTPDLFTLGGKYIEGIYTVGAVDTDYNGVEYKEFANKYMEYYGIEPSTAPVFAYDTMIALYKALLESKSTKAEAVKAAILDIGIVEGLQSTFEIDEYGDSSRDYIKFIIKDGKAVKFGD